ncbi:MAG: DEAD/DEAH box helicase [Selenomonadaceae bacterium]
MIDDEDNAFFSLFDNTATEKSHQTSEPIMLIPHLTAVRWHRSETSGTEIEVWLEFHASRTRPYMIKNIADFIRAVQNRQRLTIGKELVLEPDGVVFKSGASERLWAMLAENYRDEQSLVNYTSVTSLAKRKLHLTPTNFSRFLSIMQDEPFDFTFNFGKPEQMHGVVGAPKLSIDVADKNGNGVITLGTANHPHFSLLSGDGEFVLHGDAIYDVPAEQRKAMKSVALAFKASNHVELSKKNMGKFFSMVMPQLELVADVAVAPTFADEYEIMPLTTEVFLDYYMDGVSARVRFAYGNVSYNPLTWEAPDNVGNKRLIHDAAAEKNIFSIFSDFGFERRDGLFVLPDENKFYDFLETGVPALLKVADIYFSDAFKREPVRMPPISIGVSVNSENLLEVTLDNDMFDIDELIGILRSYKQKRRYYRLKDGAFLSLCAEQLDSLSDLFESMHVQKGEGNTAVVPLAQAIYVDMFAEENAELNLERSESFRALVRAVRNPHAHSITPPSSLVHVMRDYQVTAFEWLNALASHGLGGILADDMGLGKTLETISFLLFEKEKDEATGGSDKMHPTLVVTPTSLMYNWIDEIERFAPSLRAAVIDGNKTERTEKLKAAMNGKTDVIITTYNLLRRDIDEYENLTFRYCFLDEAQHIKNPMTQSANAVKRLTTGGYFALTGTPIENTLTELWSIFDFLMPGYLGSHHYFQSHYEVPIVRCEDKKAAQDLRRHIAPFILRRLKKDVLTELPDKVESRLICEMTAEQQKVYAAYFLRSQKEFQDILLASGVSNGHIKILSILTRLRQIACDPAMFLEDYDGGSGKLDTLDDIVPEAIAGGHRLLIFSQFTTMLTHIGERLRKLGIDYSYLDGATPAAERLRLVKEFNSDNAPCDVFLISLKAGGQGLNLTGADMVIHFDPWWNPAVEEQATDRAYRIGQEKKVQVISLVTKNTIEEKIFALQERKKALIDQMIKPGETILSKLTEEDICELFR